VGSGFQRQVPTLTTDSVLPMVSWRRGGPDRFVAGRRRLGIPGRVRASVLLPARAWAIYSHRSINCSLKRAALDDVFQKQKRREVTQ